MAHPPRLFPLRTTRGLLRLLPSRRGSARRVAAVAQAGDAVVPGAVAVVLAAVAAVLAAVVVARAAEKAATASPVTDVMAAEAMAATSSSRT